MSTVHDVAPIASKLAQVFKNGFTQVGLEVGTDVGLSPTDYIHIPTSLAKAWAYREVVEGGYDKQPEDTTATLRGKKGWTVVEPSRDKVRAHTYGGVDGPTWFITQALSPHGTRTPVDCIHVDPHTHVDLCRFILANEGHVRDGSLRASDIRWVHATRFWSVAAGLVVGSKNREFTFCDDPAGDLADVHEMAAFATDFASSALTACAARAASWRRSNHATGGSPAAGFPRRWLEAQQMWTQGNEVTDKKVKDDRTSATDAFYVATHATAVHNTLAMMAPTDEGHWATIDPRWGLIFSWDIMPSTMVRIAPKTQVAGTAMVVDSMVVFKMMVQSCLAPLLENFSEWRALQAQYALVLEHGVRAASYAQWFLEGHPEKIGRLSFNQKDSICSSLIGELAAVACKYYEKTTIGRSPALRNAYEQLAPESAKDLWAAMSKQRQAASQDVAMKAYVRIMGSSAASSVINMASEDEDIVGDAVDKYNESLQIAADGVGLSNVPTLVKKLVVGNIGVSADNSVAGDN
jgi:hypothetical protein